MADSEKGLQLLLDTVVIESILKGLCLNAKKTEYMVVSKKSVNPICNLISINVVI